MGLDLEEIVLAVEQEFDLEIPDADASKILSFGHMFELVFGRLEERARQSGGAPVDGFQLWDRLLEIQTEVRAHGIRCSSCDSHGSAVVCERDGWGFALCLDCVAAARDALARRIRTVTPFADRDAQDVEMPPCQFCWSRRPGEHSVDFGRGRVCKGCLKMVMEIFAE